MAKDYDAEGALRDAPFDPFAQRVAEHQLLLVEPDGQSGVSQCLSEWAGDRVAVLAGMRDKDVSSAAVGPGCGGGWFRRVGLGAEPELRRRLKLGGPEA